MGFAFDPFELGYHSLLEIFQLDFLLVNSIAASFDFLLEIYSEFVDSIIAVFDLCLEAYSDGCLARGVQFREASCRLARYHDGCGHRGEFSMLQYRYINV